MNRPKSQAERFVNENQSNCNFECINVFALVSHIFSCSIKVCKQIVESSTLSFVLCTICEGLTQNLEIRDFS